MEKKRSSFTASNSEQQNKTNENAKTKDTANKARGDCNTPASSSHTRFLKKNIYERKYEYITRKQYFGDTESISSSDTMQCIHGPEGKQYTERSLLKRNLLKGLDPLTIDSKWTSKCHPTQNWDIVGDIEYLVRGSTVSQQLDRLESHLQDLVQLSERGYYRIHVQRIDKLNSICVILDYLVETVYTKPYGEKLRNALRNLLENMEKPLRLNVASDVITHFDGLRNYMGFLGYLLLRMEDDQFFDIVSKAILWQLSTPDETRGPGCAHRRHVATAAAPVLYQTTVRMIAIASSHRFPTFLEIALLLACDSVVNCIEMLKENILENIFYRFNPYFPDRKLPPYDIGPLKVDDTNVLLGDSSVHMNTTLSLLLVLVKTLLKSLKRNPDYKKTLPCPDGYGQLCFVWAYRYECRAREHHHQRITLTVVVSALLTCFGDRLYDFSPILMPDILSLAVLTELPSRSDWTKSVNFNTAQSDVQFKKVLIHTSVQFLKTFPYNKCMIESRYWLIGIMYLLDPGLAPLRMLWAPSLFDEIRKTALQALVCILPLVKPTLVKEYGIIRRIMWYIEWYSESPYELSVLYWCVRVLQVAIYKRNTMIRNMSLKDLFDTHGIIILIHLCYTLLDQKVPPVEKSQVIIALSLRLLTSAVLEPKVYVSCCVYPDIKWPSSVNALAKKMLDVILFSLNNHLILSDRWLISLLNFIWQGIIWFKDYRHKFIQYNGVYKLLDIISMSRPPVQCISLAILCDIARAGEAVGQLITWRAGFPASNVNPVLVSRGETIAGLLAAVFKDECKINSIRLNDNGVIQDLDFPIMSYELRREINDPNFLSGKSQRTSVCLAAGELAGSRMSKAYALLHMLSEDLSYKVSIADEAYNLYKNIKLTTENEVTLVLVSYYLTLKLNEAWMEIHLQCPNLLPQDFDTVDEFVHINKGWAKEIKKQQEIIVEKAKKKELDEEQSLYEFLGRVRLNIALDALREVRCVARSSDRSRITHSLLNEAVSAHHRRSLAAEQVAGDILRTYAPPLDDRNMTGQSVKVFSISPKEKPKPKCEGRFS